MEHITARRTAAHGAHFPPIDPKRSDGWIDPEFLETPGLIIIFKVILSDLMVILLCRNRQVWKRRIQVARTVQNRPPVWSLIKEAVESMNGEATYKEIKDYIWQKYQDVNERTINCQIIICSVNQKSRIYYPANRKPRECQSRYDFLYTLGNGRVTLYKPEEHGLWGILEKDGRIAIGRLDDDHGLKDEGGRPGNGSSPEYLEIFDVGKLVLENIGLLGNGLYPYQDSEGRSGMGYPTETGTIDVLAVDREDCLVAVKLTEQVSPQVVSEILGQMAWVRKHLASGGKVKGMLLARQVDESMVMPVSEITNLELYRVKVSIELDHVC
jgi:hypothetical protein